MIIGSHIEHSDTGSTSYYSAVFARRGFAAVFQVDVTHIKGSSTLLVSVEHKNKDETSWAAAGTFANITTAGTATKEIENLKEVLRFAFAFDTGGVAGDFFHVIVGTPSWRLYA